MAYCPNCGSERIQLKKETDVNWGRAVAGWVLFGVVGDAGGAVTGEDRNVNTCLDCGTSWKASDLYSALQIIENLTNEKLDLSIEKDREYMSSFMTEMSHILTSSSKVEKIYEKLITDKENDLNPGVAIGIGYGCGTWIVCLFSAASLLGGWGLFLTLILFPVMGGVLGGLSDKQKKKSNLKWIENTRREAVRENAEARETLQLEVRKFMQKYPRY
jgi:hypothetical protein